MIINQFKKVGKSIADTVSNTVDDVITPDPTADDISNANQLYAALHTWYGLAEDEEKAAEIVLRYTKASYPMLKKAYRKTYPDEPDLTERLNNLLGDSTDNYTKIASIIN